MLRPYVRFFFTELAWTGFGLPVPRLSMAARFHSYARKQWIVRDAHAGEQRCLPEHPEPSCFRQKTSLAFQIGRASCRERV